MDHLRAGYLLCRSDQRSAVGQTRRVERSVVPAPPRRGQGAVRFEATASEDPPHPGGTAAARTDHRPGTHSARKRRNGLRHAQTSGPRLFGRAQGRISQNRTGDPERRLRHDHLHVGHDGRSERRRSDPPQLHGQRRTVALAHRHPVQLPHAHHPAAGPLFRARGGILHHDRLRRQRGDRTNRGDPDGDAQEYSAEYPRSETQLPAVGAGTGQKFPQKHRNFDSGQRTFHRTVVRLRAPHGLYLQSGRLPQRQGLADPAGTRRGTFRPRTVPQGAGGIRRQPGVFRRGRRTARFGAATLFLCHRDPDVPGIRTLGSYTRHFDQFAQVPLAQVRIVGQDSRTARPENPRRRGARAAARPKG